MTTNEQFSQTTLVDMMHARGLRPSAQRLAVLEFVANHRTHPSAEEVYAAVSPLFPSLSRNTVYSSLHALTECGLLRELDIESGNRRYDLAPQPPHGHFVCRSCGRIIDAAMPAGLDLPAGDGFEVETVDVFYRGLCPDCRIKLINNQ